MLLTEKTKEATLQEKLNKKRNLFGLGLTSLIAACGSDAATNAGSIGETEEERIAREAREADEARKAEEAAEAKRIADEKAAQEARADALPFKALTSEDESGFTATKGGGAGSLTVAVEKPAAGTATLTFDDATEGGARANIYKLTPNADQYDLVIASYTFNQVDSSDPEYQKGRIFIYWDVASITDKDSAHLEIKGAKADDRIGTFAPEFFKINDSNNYYMVIRSHLVDRPVDASADIENAGAIYILWDVIEYIGESKTIDLGASNNDNGDFATSGSLAIYGATAGDQIGAHGLHFLQIGGTDNNHDMAIRSHLVNGEKGAIYILWDVADYAGENRGITLDNDLSDEATAGSLTIYGGRALDQIGAHAPEFLQLGGTDNDYDMVIRSPLVDRPVDASTYIGNAGAIYILWDVIEYIGESKTIDLGASNNDNGDFATSGSLAIYGAKRSDVIGTNAPEFLKIGGTDNKYDMVIRSKFVDKSGAGATLNEGAIYVLWDVADYAGENRGITLDNDLSDEATAGSLTIYGGTSGDHIGTFAPEFSQIGGEADNYDMVIRSGLVDYNNIYLRTGVIYILWDVADYANQNIGITLDSNLSGEATAGSLAIYGAKSNDSIGSYTSEFSQIGGKDDNYDMVIRSDQVEKFRSNDLKNEGAIYILWDVVDYYGTGTDANKIINLTTAAATSGLLTIYGKATGAKLGSNDKNILYGYDDDGNKILTNIDGDTAGTKDIAFRDGKYTYILFGDKVADTGVDNKVDSKTIDLAAVETTLGANNAAFFGYDFVDNALGSATTPVSTADIVGYRFNGRKADLAAVQTDYDRLSSSLSDTDADFAVWDIA